MLLACGLHVYFGKIHGHSWHVYTLYLAEAHDWSWTSVENTVHVHHASIVHGAAFTPQVCSADGMPHMLRTALEDETRSS